MALRARRRRHQPIKPGAEPQHLLYFDRLPQGQGSFGMILTTPRRTVTPNRRVLSFDPKRNLGSVVADAQVLAQCHACLPTHGITNMRPSLRFPSAVQKRGGELCPRPRIWQECKPAVLTDQLHPLCLQHAVQSHQGRDVVLDVVDPNLEVGETTMETSQAALRILEVNHRLGTELRL